MNTSRCLTSFAMICGLALVAAPAAFAGKDADSHLTKMDTNGDGQISRAEHTAGAQQMFAKCDANQDGLVTAAEMDTAMATPGEKPGKYDKASSERIQMSDQNGDGQLTATEHAAGADKMFAKMDANGDGSLSKDECAAGIKMKKKEK